MDSRTRGQLQGLMSLLQGTHYPDADKLEMECKRSLQVNSGLISNGIVHGIYYTLIWTASPVS